jgi:hypothetical protein
MPDPVYSLYHFMSERGTRKRGKNSYWLSAILPERMHQRVVHQYTYQKRLLIIRQRVEEKYGSKYCVQGEP